MKVFTWNVNSLRARMEQVERLINEQAPDVLCLQELKLEEDKIPLESFHRWGYPHVVGWGQTAYNGVAMLSKDPIIDPQRGFIDYDDDQARVVAGTVNGVRIYGLYTPNGQTVGAPAFHYKLKWLEQLRTELDRYSTDQDLLVCGDMNVAPSDLDVWDPFKAEGRILAHPDERAAIQALIDWGLVDAYREANAFDAEFSWWDYQKMGFQRNHGMRIDHIYLTQPLYARCDDVTIHRDVRGWPSPSDHAPVSVTLRT